MDSNRASEVVRSRRSEFRPRECVCHSLGGFASVTHWVVVGTRFWPAAVLFCPSSAHTALQGSCHPWGQGQVLPEAHEALHDLPGPSLPSPQCPLCFTNRSS